MANYIGMPMEQLHQIAMAEMQNIGPVMESAQLWAVPPPVLADSRGVLSQATGTLGAEWPDKTFPQFQAMVDEGVGSIKNSEQIVSQAKPDQVLQQLAGQIETTGNAVDQINQQWIQLKQLLDQLMAMAAAGLGALLGPVIAAIKAQMLALERQAGGHLNTLAGAYQQGAQTVQAAGSGHNVNGPTAASPPTPGADSDEVTAARPPVTVTSFAPDAGQAGTTQADQLRQAQLDAARAAEAAAEAQNGTGDAGLAGGLATAPPLAATLPAASTPAPAPVSAGASPVAGVPLSGVTPVARTGIGPVPVAGATGRQTSTSIPKAARVSGGITAAGTGQAPVLPAEPTAVARGTGSRTAPAAPVGAVPPMLSPQALGKLQNLIGRLKPVVTRHGSTGDLGAKRVAGVPDTLRGRTGRPDDEFAMSNGQRSRRSRKETDDAPETVELLDEELWRVEQTQTGTAARTAG
jgi:hypothetical protein